MSTAMKRFNQAWLLDPSNPGIYHGFALITYVRDHDVKAADQFFRHAIDLGDKTVGVYADYGRFLGETGRPAEAVTAFRQAIAIDPDHKISHQGLVLSHARTGDMTAACDQLRVSSALGLSLDPSFVAALARANGRSCIVAPAN